MKMVLRGAFSQIGIGLALGIPSAIGAGKLMNDQLFGVKPWDPAHADVIATLLLGSAALLASADPGAARGRSGADGGTAKRVMSANARAAGKNLRQEMMERLI